MSGCKHIQCIFSLLLTRATPHSCPLQRIAVHEGSRRFRGRKGGEKSARGGSTTEVPRSWGRADRTATLTHRPSAVRGEQQPEKARGDEGAARAGRGHPPARAPPAARRRRPRDRAGGVHAGPHTKKERAVTSDPTLTAASPRLVARVARTYPPGAARAPRHPPSGRRSPHVKRQ